VGQSELDDAEFRLTSALRAVQIAEKNGVDVKSYVDVLNSTLSMLKEAEALNISGNVTQAAVTAKTVTSISIQVEANVASYTSLASRRAEVDFQLAVIKSSLVSIISVIVIYFGWIFFNRWYLTKVIDMKPEVTSDES
jgi:hypothetical protein